MNIAPSLFVNHGAGPYPLMNHHENVQIAQSLKHVSEYIDLIKLKSIIIVTAHWETGNITISSSNQHKLLYDYNHFPPEAYKYEYPASGNEELAMKIHLALKNEDILSILDSKRGWDHGVFIPMMLINPKANIPIVQISILKNQDAEQHYKIGEVLKQFRKDGVAIFGSGMTYHNENGFKKARPSDGLVENEYFDRFLDEACQSDDVKRKEMLLHWDTIDGALESHPLGEADHLMPLIVNAGAGGHKGAEKVFSGCYLEKFKISGYVWRNL